MAKGSGLFPTPAEIQFSCSCPDWASMCKHVAATLYGIGARLDQDPSLFFMLRRVNMDDLIAKALEETTGQWIQKAEDNTQPTIAEADLGNVFGIDMDAMPDFGTITAEAAAIHSVTDKPKKAARPPQGASRKQLKTKAVDEKNQILDLVQRATNGIKAVELHQKSGIAIIKIRNVLYQAHRKGAIEKASRGVYRAKAAQPKQLSAADRHVAVLAAVRAAPKGIRAPQVAEATGLRLATVRPVMARLLAESAIRRTSRGVYGPPSPTRKKKSTIATGAILSMIKTHPKGVGIAALKEQSGCEEKQLRNIIFRLFKSGKIRRAGRGIYLAASERK
jgi:DNA-binding IclR family transcriptional regulator